MSERISILTRLKIIVYLITLFLSFNIAAKAVGSVQPPNAILRGFIENCEDKPQPCWFGIMPGVTTVNEAKLLLSQFSPNELDCTRFWQSEMIVYQIRLCSPTRIGDLDYYFGNIHKLFLDPTFEVTFPSLLFQDGNIQALPRYDVYKYHEYRYSPFDPYFFILVNSVPPAIQIYNWHGFVPKWRYCQLEPIFKLC
jgi:hypothetical protein